MSEKADIVEDNSELYEHHRVVADPGQSLLRVDKFLFNHLANISRNKIQQAAKAGNILVNEKQVKPNHRIKPGDVVSVVLAYPPREVEIIPQEIKLDIVRFTPAPRIHPMERRSAKGLRPVLAHSLSDEPRRPVGPPVA